MSARLELPSGTANNIQNLRKTDSEIAQAIDEIQSQRIVWNR